EGRFPAQLAPQPLPGGVDPQALLPDAPANLHRPAVPEIAADLPGDLGYGVGGELGAVGQVEAPHGLEKPQASQLVEVIRLHAAAIVAAHDRPDQAAVLPQNLLCGRLVPIPGQGQQVQGVGGHRPAGLGSTRRRMVTRVPLPGAERTVTLSMKDSIMVKPMPLRSSPPVVYRGWRACSTSSIPRPQSRTVTSRTLSSRIFAFTTTRPRVSG